MNMLKRQKSINVIMAWCLLLCLSVISLVTSNYVTNLTIDSCFQKLRESTQQFSREIRQNVENDRKLLELTAEKLAEMDTLYSSKSQEILSYAQASTMISSMGILLPNNQVVIDNDKFADNLGELSYKEEVEKMTHLTSRLVDKTNPEEYYLYHIVPIVRDGNTLGLLCGVIELAKQQEIYSQILGEDNTRFHLIDGNSGDLLVDTMHPQLGNISRLTNRKVKKGYDAGQTLLNMSEGKEGEIVFFSVTLNKSLYCVYEPVGLDNWIVMLGQPENIAFQDATFVQKALYRALAVEAVIFLFYLMLILWRTRSEAQTRERELNRVQYMQNIGELLFNAPSNPELFETALHEIAEVLQAKMAFLVVYNAEEEDQLFLSQKESEDLEIPYRREDFPILYSKFLMKQQLISYNIAELMEGYPEEYQLLKQLKADNLMMIPIKKLENHQLGADIGCLGVINMNKRFETTDLLDCVMVSFSMATKNMESLRAFKEMGTIDRLTGLKNRNSFQKAMEENEKLQDDSLACIYMDADGLHDINNHFGHEAGDRLLRVVADIIKKEFGQDSSYRIGGDEFLVFSRGLNKEQVMQRVEKMERNVSIEGYHISTGVEWRNKVPLVYEMVKRAEEKMFESKQLYYKRKGREDQMRKMNRQLEETLLEKRDLDVFRTVLSSKYLGVYIVDFSLDAFRSIFIPPYFMDAAEQSGGKFSDAIRIYIKQYVDPAFQNEFMELLDYQKIKVQLDEGYEPQLCYRRHDGIRILLKIYRSPDYSEERKEYIWTFENAVGE